MADKLTARQLRFVDEYLVDLNATQAAIRAGYKPKAAQEVASRLLTYPQVKARVQEAMDKRASRTEITQDRVLNELARIGFSGMSKVARWNASGVTFLDSSEMDADALASVQEVSESTNQHGGSLKIKQYDKVRALELIGKHLGMFTERLEVFDGDRPLEELSDAELLAKLKGHGK